MDYSGIANIFQLNIALGILYIGLPKFRFRENLYSNIVKSIKLYGNSKPHWTETEEDQNRFALDDSSFSKKRHFICAWVNALPDDYPEKTRIKKIVDFGSWKPPRKISSRHIYNWFFARGCDKCLAGLFCIIFSIAALWIGLLDSLKESLDIWMIYCAILGQATIIFNTCYGQLTAWWVKKKLNRSLLYMENKLRQGDARMSLKETFNRLLSSSTD